MSGLRAVTLTLCGACIAGEGGECHTPGCALWMNRAPDIPLSIEPHARLLVNEDRTVLVRELEDGTVEVAVRPDSDAIWGPPVRVVPERS